jgi:hypothetical protein
MFCHSINLLDFIVLPYAARPLGFLDGGSACYFISVAGRF